MFRRGDNGSRGGRGGLSRHARYSPQSRQARSSLSMLPMHYPPTTRDTPGTEQGQITAAATAEASRTPQAADVPVEREILR